MSNKIAREKLINEAGTLWTETTFVLSYLISNDANNDQLSWLMLPKHSQSVLPIFT